MKKILTKPGTVRFKYDPANPPRWTAEDKARFDAIRDEDIDTSDAPEITDFAGWTRPGALIPAANKVALTIRYDSDVVAFFKKTGQKYQTRMNAVLRAYMLAHKKQSAKSRQSDQPAGKSRRIAKKPKAA